MIHPINQHTAQAKTIKAIAVFVTVFLISACGGGGGAATVNSPPVASAGNSFNLVVGDLATLDATASSDANNDTLSYSWILSNQPSGSTAALSGSSIANPTFTADKLGVYIATVTVTDNNGGSSSASINVTAVANSAPIANAGANQTVNLNAIVNLNGSNSTDANNDALSYAWSFVSKPAGSTATLSNPTSVSPTFVPDINGTYTVQLYATDRRGAVSLAPSVVTVTVTSQPAIINNTFSVACGASDCGTMNATTYSGSSIGVWRYNNTTASPASINIDISGVSAGKQVTLAFTNGSNSNASSAPAFGTQASLEPNADSLSSQSLFLRGAKKILHDTQEEKHHHMLERNASLKARLHALKISSDTKSNAAKPLATPALNASKNWVDYFDDTPVTYTTTNRHVCTLPNGRKVVFWQDNSDTYVTPAILTTFTTAGCGASGGEVGGFARINDLLGDAWGSHSYNNLIKDTATAKQDINVIFVKTSVSAGWAGYFYGGNNFTSTASNPSNEALAFFINTNGIPSDVDYYVSTLFHEATHMVNFYQNDVKLSKTRQTWLEETSAMMTEDLVTPAVTGYNKIISYRLPAYLGTGGNISLNTWPDLSSNHYHMGGAFGAFLNRQYGINIYKQIVSGCISGSAKTDSYACLDSVLLNNGSFGIKEELTRMGATLYARMPAAATPAGYGYGAKSYGAYSLAGVDLTAFTISSPISVSTYNSMSQTYLNETIATGKTRYIRNNVVIPAGTNLQVTIK